MRVPITLSSRAMMWSHFGLPLTLTKIKFMPVVPMTLSLLFAYFDYLLKRMSL